MAEPIIQSVGVTSGPGTPGQGRKDLVPGERVDLSDTEPANALKSYFWEWDDTPLDVTPPTINDANTSIPWFIVDADSLLPGSYRIKATVDGVESSVEVLAVPTANIGSRIPSHEEEKQYDGAGNSVGWHRSQTDHMRAVDVALGNIGSSTERAASMAIPIGATTKTIRLGRVAYPGSLLAIAAEISENITAGSVLIEVRVNSVVKLSIILAPGTPGNDSIVAAGVHNIANGDIIDLVVTVTGHDNASSTPSGVAISTYLSNSISSTPLSTTDASNVSKGVTKLSVAPAIATEPVAAGTNDTRIPVQAQTDALVGTAGSPSTGNPFVTNTDSRNSNARTPTAHSHVKADVTDFAHTHVEADISDLVHTTPGGPGTDTTAIHDNVAGEISALPEKVSPVGGDHVIIEDSENSDAKARVLMSNMLGGSAVSAQGDYIQAKLSVPQVQTWAADDPVHFDTIHQGRGNLSVDANGKFGLLRANRTYVLHGSVQTSDGGSRIPFSWHDVTNNAPIGSTYVATSTNIASVAAYNQLGLTLFTPLVDTEVEFRCRAAATVGGNITVASSNGWGDHLSTAAIYEIGAVQAEVVGGLEFMDIIEVTADQTSVVFGAGGDGAFGRELDGNVDGEYVLSYYLPDTAAAITLRPNAVDPAVDTTFDGATHLGGQSTVNASQANWQINSQSAGYTESGELHVQVEAGIPRTFTGKSALFNGLAAGRWIATVSGRWENTTSNISSLQLFSSVAAGIKIGARFVLWRRTRQNLRADSAAVYERRAELGIPVNVAFSYDVTLGRAIYGGSLAGMEARLEDDINSGSVTVDFKVNAVSKLLMTVDLNSPNVAGGTTELIRKAIGEIPIAAGDHLSLTVASAGLNVISGDPTGILVNCHLVNNGLITQNDRVVAKKILTANATTLSVTGLDGDLDGEYEIEGSLFLTLLSNNVAVAPNGSSTNVRTSRSINGAGALTDLAGLFLASSAVSTRNEYTFSGRMWVSRTRNGVARLRAIRINGTHSYGSSPFINVDETAIVLEDVSANLLSIDFVSSVASGILAGSEIVVRRIKA